MIWQFDGQKRLRNRRGEVPDTSLSGGSEGKKGVLITDWALYGSEGWPRKPLEELNPCIVNNRLYFERKDADALSKKKGISADIHGNPTDGTLMTAYINFMVDMLRYKALSSADGNDFIAEIVTMDEQDYEGFQTMANQGSQIDAHTAQVDALVAEVLQISLGNSEKVKLWPILAPPWDKVPYRQKTAAGGFDEEDGCPKC